MIVFDLDNTLSDAEHRSWLARDKRWDDFHAQAGQDTVIEPVRRLYQALWNDGEQIVILTGRPQKYQSVTLDWLDEHRIQCNQLLMRPDDNFTQDFEFKAGVLKWLCHEQSLKPEQVVVFEDRDTVVKALRPLGYTVLQVRESLY